LAALRLPTLFIFNMQTYFKQTPVEQFVRTFVQQHKKGSQQSGSKYVTIAIGLINAKITNDSVNLRLYPGQYSQLTLGVHAYLTGTKVEGNLASLNRAKAMLQAL
jgi:hypothetical protein